MFFLPVPEMQKVIECFILELRRQDLNATTITGYISHISEYLKIRGVEVTIRSDLSGALRTCFRRQDQLVAPLRLPEKIPIPAPVLLLIFEDIKIHATDARTRDETLAICAIAYGLCLRIHEAIPDGRTTDTDGLPMVDHSIMTPHLSFTFADDYRVYKASRPEDFPVGKFPQSFSAYHDSLKNMPGGTGTRSVGANPNVYSFGLVEIVYHYVCTYRPPPEGHLFPNVKSVAVNAYIKRTFNSVGLDGSRGCPHAMRVGSESMIRALQYSQKGLTTEK